MRCSGIFVLSLLATFSGIVVSDRPTNSEAQFIDEFYKTVQGCPEDYSKLLKLRTLVSDDMIWRSADNVTFISGDVFCIYTCFPFSGISMYDRTIINEIAEWMFTDNGVERHIISNNFLLYNITKDPVFNDPTDPVPTFFKESDDFTLIRNPGFPRIRQRYLVSEISSYASPRDLYRVLGWFVDGIVPPTKKKRDIPTEPRILFWPFIPPNTIIDHVNITIADLAH